MDKVVVLMLLSGMAFAQPDTIPPDPGRHIFVVDQDGNPVSGASIDHSGVLLQGLMTDARGSLTLKVHPPAVVIRKPGFLSQFVRLQDIGDIRVTLAKSTENRSFRPCPDEPAEPPNQLKGPSFRFPAVLGVSASGQGHDFDYDARSYTIDEKGGFLHGWGFMWSLGPPSDSAIWASVNYKEITYERTFPEIGTVVWIIDGAGEFNNGMHWRYLGKFGESASYYNVDPAAAKLLDQVLDGACLPGDY